MFCSQSNRPGVIPWCRWWWWWWWWLGIQLSIIIKYKNTKFWGSENSVILKSLFWVFLEFSCSFITWNLQTCMVCFSFSFQIALFSLYFTQNDIMMKLLNRFTLSFRKDKKTYSLTKIYGILEHKIHSHELKCV